MELTSISTIACIVPTIDPKEPIFASATFKPQELKYTKQIDEYQLSVQGKSNDFYTIDEDKTLNWIVNKVMTPKTLGESLDEQDKLLNYALKGYDVACLSVSVGNDMYKERRKNIDEILQKLSSKLDASNNIFQIEYAYVGIKDESCYDFRKEVERSNESMLGKGMDGIMKKVGNIMAIWTILQRDSSIPTIMTIKLTNLKKNTVGRLVLIDLLHPRFSLLYQKGKEKSFFSFSKLRNAVADITTPGKTSQLDLSSCFLTKETAKYISGHNKLIVFGFLNDKMLTEMQARETKYLLDFISSLKDIPVRMMPNTTTQNQIENKLFKVQMAKATQNIEKLKLLLQKAQNDNLELRKDITVKQTNLESFDKTRILEVDFLRQALEKNETLYTSEIEQLRSDIERLIAALEEKDINEKKNLTVSREIQSRNQEFEMTISHLQDRLQIIQQKNHDQLSQLVEKLEFVSNEANYAKNQSKFIKQENKHLEMQLDSLKFEQERLKMRYDASASELNESTTQLKAAKLEQSKLKASLQIEEMEQRKLKTLLETEQAENARLKEKLELKIQKLGKYKKMREEYEEQLNVKSKEMKKEYEQKLNTKSEEMKEEYEEKFNALMQSFIQKKKKIQAKARATIEQMEPTLNQNQEKIDLLTNSLKEAKKEIVSYKSKLQSLEESTQHADEIIPIRAKKPKVLSKVNSRRRPQPRVEENNLMDIDLDLKYQTEAIKNNMSSALETQIPEELNYPASSSNLYEEIPEELAYPAVLSNMSEGIPEEASEESIDVTTLPDDVPEEYSDFITPPNVIDEPKPLTRKRKTVDHFIELPKKSQSKERATASSVKIMKSPKKTQPKEKTKTSSVETTKSPKKNQFKERITRSSIEAIKSPKKNKPEERITRSSIEAIKSPLRETASIKYEVKDDEITRSPVLGTTVVRGSPDRTINNSQSSTGKKRRKLRSSAQYHYFPDHLQDIDGMSPLSKFIKSTET